MSRRHNGAGTSRSTTYVVYFWLTVCTTLGIMPALMSSFAYALNVPLSTSYTRAWCRGFPYCELAIFIASGGMVMALLFPEGLRSIIFCVPNLALYCYNVAYIIVKACAPVILQSMHKGNMRRALLNVFHIGSTLRFIALQKLLLL